MAPTVPSSQSTISAFFASTPRKSGKRAHSPIDLTSDNETEKRETTHKKARTTSKPSASLDTAEPVATSIVGTWSYSPQTEKEAGPSKPRTAFERARHEAFKKKLLQDNSVFLKKDSQEPVDSDRDQDSDECDEDSEEGSQTPKSLSKLFSHRGNEKSKSDGKNTKRGKPPPMLGPGGKSYTPLEQQVSTTTSSPRVK